MDEVRMVRDSYPEPPPPTAQMIGRARALLDGPPRRSRPRLGWGLGGGLVAAGAAAAVAIAFTGGNAPAPAPSGTVSLDGKAAFLAAAEKAEQQPVGRYWYADVVSGQSYIMRARTGTYAITGAHDETFGWWGAKSGMGEAYYGRDLPARPLTARDAELWRKAGSPSSFRVRSDDRYITYTTKATKWRSDGPEKGTYPHGGGKFLDGKSVEQLQSLPTDPAKLAKEFLGEADAAAGLPAGKGLPPEQRASSTIHRVASIMDAPLPPKVRAGLMRALAAQPGVRAIGRDSDPLGRRGIALASGERTTTVTAADGRPASEAGTYRSRTVIIFDERTGAMLSRQEELTRSGGEYREMRPGFVIEYQTLRSAAWTGTRPAPPSELPFK
ncbi:CU044_5270 family protein [Actinomadura fibrosa]|uniref:CU044_5270 family protein n=1 Tax=Actinomadura fibrosa TaxID=111802 RepID=A0ABW2XDB8_9ACTN|nr:CU044_5270 family protein [Actinomadura fibrosa]